MDSFALITHIKMENIMLLNVLVENYQGSMMLMLKQCPIECFLLSHFLVLL